MTWLGQAIFLAAWVFLLCALVAEGFLRARERDEAHRRACADMYVSNKEDW